LDGHSNCSSLQFCTSSTSVSLATKAHGPVYSSTSFPALGFSSLPRSSIASPIPHPLRLLVLIPAFGRYATHLLTAILLGPRLTGPRPGSLCPTRPAHRGLRSPLRDSLLISHRLGPCTRSALLAGPTRNAPPSARAQRPGSRQDGSGCRSPSNTAAHSPISCTAHSTRPALDPTLSPRHYSAHEPRDSDPYVQSSSSRVRRRRKLALIF
jgi:hypothetical protein